jgi:hypothetical protein
MISIAAVDCAPVYTVTLIVSRAAPWFSATRKAFGHSRQMPPSLSAARITPKVFAYVRRDFGLKPGFPNTSW